MTRRDDGKSPQPANPAEDADPPIRDFAHSLPMALLRAREAVMQYFRPMLREYDLTEQQWRVLRALMDNGSLEISELSARSYILMPSLSRILQNLESRGLVYREAVASDQRRARISVTEAGETLFKAIAPHSEMHYGEIAEAMGPENMDALYALLDTLTARLNRDQNQ
jgi:homoprotocatechuate degradation regulator HpaR